MTDARKPAWIRSVIPSDPKFFKVKRLVQGNQLATVCEEAKCPNIGECWAAGTATFMIMGDTCTRACRFCNVKTGNPQGWLDHDEPRKVAESCQRMKLKYVVITMVDRDDLPDLGASHIEKVVTAIKAINPHIRIELLAGDMSGQADFIARLAQLPLDVLAHNLETVARLTPRVRDRRATYSQSLEFLKRSKSISPGVYTKSSLMLGLGETIEEIRQTMIDLRTADVDFLTLGQYMRPTKKHLSVKEWLSPEIFAELKAVALELGFKACASGPLVRSSYRAEEFFSSQVLDRKAVGSMGGP